MKKGMVRPILKVLKEVRTAVFEIFLFYFVFLKVHYIYAAIVNCK
jgi:hypothetical protein